MITFRRLAAADLPLLRGWLAAPHVARWWDHETSVEAVERDFGPGVRGEEPGEDLVALLDGHPLGLVQRSWVADHEEDLRDFATALPVPEGAVTIDYLIGDVQRTGRGLGPAMIRAVVEDTWRTRPAATCVLVSVVAANRASWRALEHAGFARVATTELEPDPIDDPLHVVYRVDRPG